MFSSRFFRNHRIDQLKMSWRIHSCMQTVEHGDGSKTRTLTRQLSNYVGMLAKTLGRVFNVDLDCFDLWWMQNSDLSAPVKELGLAVHYNGTLSVLIIPSFFCSDHVLGQLEKKGVSVKLYKGNPPSLSNTQECQTIISVTHSFEDKDNLLQTLQTIEQIVAVSPNIKKLFTDVRDYLHLLPVKEMADDLASLFHKTDVFLNSDAVISDDVRYQNQLLKESIESKFTTELFVEGWLSHFNYPTIPNDVHCVGSTVGLSASLPYQRYCHEIHDDFPTGRTPVTQALLDDNEDAFLYSLSDDPFAALRPDAYNLCPIDFCIYTGCIKFLPGLLDVVSRVPVECPWQLNRITLAKHFLANPSLLGRNAENGGELRQHYREMETRLIAQRAPIHIACVQGNINDVRQILDDNPEAVNAVDPWGMTPLVIALGKDHIDLIGLLLAKRGKARSAGTQGLWFDCQYSIHTLGIAGKCKIIRCS